MTSDRLPLTDVQLEAMKRDNLKEFPHHALFADKDGRVYNCEGCNLRRTCPFSMDPYNTDCDCLADK